MARNRANLKLGPEGHAIGARGRLPLRIAQPRLFRAPLVVERIVQILAPGLDTQALIERIPGERSIDDRVDGLGKPVVGIEKIAVVISGAYTRLELAHGQVK